MSANDVPLDPNRCCICTRTRDEIAILNERIYRNIALVCVGTYVNPICTECLRDYKEAIFEQVIYGDQKCKASTVADKCLTLLLHREHPDVGKDRALIRLLNTVDKAIVQFKPGKDFRPSDLCDMFDRLADKWNKNTAKHQCRFVFATEQNDDQLLISIQAFMSVDGHTSECFTIQVTGELPTLGNKGLVIPK